MNIAIENKNFLLEISTLGAEIQHFVKKDDGTNLIWNGDKSVWKNHAPILFPFVARCLGGYFFIDGKKCEFSKNHGFARDLETKIIEKQNHKAVFLLTQNEETLKKFPYKFSLITEYELTEDGLNWKITVKNDDDKPFYFGIGTHTAFACPRNTDKKGTEISDYEIVFENQEALTNVVCTEDGYIEVDKNNNPLTKIYGEKQKGIIPLNETGFGNGHLFTDFTSNWVGLKNKKTGSIITISTKNFPYCMIWQNTVGEPQFVCIEPWHGIPDPINTNHIWEDKIGMNKLDAKKEFISEQNIRVKF